jgi:hypothetical protein
MSAVGSAWTSLPLQPILERLDKIERQLSRIAAALEGRAK